jgi:hypothetical protein
MSRETLARALCAKDTSLICYSTWIIVHSQKKCFSTLAQTRTSCCTFMTDYDYSSSSEIDFLVPLPLLIHTAHLTHHRLHRSSPFSPLQLRPPSGCMFLWCMMMRMGRGPKVGISLCGNMAERGRGSLGLCSLLFIGGGIESPESSMKVLSEYHVRCPGISRPD